MIGWKDNKSKNPVVELKKIWTRGELIPLAEEYIRNCKLSGDIEARGSGKGRSQERFPNIAGFARTLGVGVSNIKNIESKWPELYGALLALFEDEALNSDKNATVLNAYIKERLNFGEKKEGGATLPVGDVRLVFDHDIGEDGRWAEKR